MRLLQRFPAETRRAGYVLLALFAVVAVIGATRLRGQTTAPSSCGNGLLDPGEECDEVWRNGVGPTCTANCTKVRCGDGIVTLSVGEECDTGSGSTQPACGRICTVPTCDGDECSGGCRWSIVACTSSASSVPTSSAAAVSSSPPSSSSRGSSVASGEPAVASEAASFAAVSSAAPAVVSSSAAPIVASSVPSAAPVPSSAAAESSVVPPEPVASSAEASSVAEAASSEAPPASSAEASSASSVEEAVAVCGDGWIHAPEECDDGNILDGDGCQRDCTRGEVTVPFCGDGETQEPEQCDAGAGNSNAEPDACRTNCRAAFCGDGVKDSGEACDDGNADDYDGCTWKCEMSMCGNGVIEPLEECDIGDGNSNVKPNTCRTVCRKPWCGDGVIDAGEECDVAQRIDADGCSNDCKLLCPPGATKIQGRCLILKAAAEKCGVFCAIGNAWEGFVDWLFGFFE